MKFYGLSMSLQRVSLTQNQSLPVSLLTAPVSYFFKQLQLMLFRVHYLFGNLFARPNCVALLPRCI